MRIYPHFKLKFVVFLKGKKKKKKKCYIFSHAKEIVRILSGDFGKL